MWSYGFVLAVAPYDARAALPDVAGPAAAFVRQKRLLAWLRDQLAAREIEALGPYAGEQGWALAVNADDGFVFVLIDLGAGGEPLRARVDYVGAAEVEAEDVACAVEAILAASPSVRRFEAA